LKSLNAVFQVAHFAVEFVVTRIGLCACFKDFLRVGKLAFQVRNIRSRAIVFIS